VTCSTKVQHSVSLKQLRAEWPRIEAELAGGLAFAVERHGRTVAFILPVPKEVPQSDPMAELRGLAARLAALATRSAG